MNEASSRVEFVMNAEAGILERQALLLCESIRRFAGTLSTAPITVVSPRKERRPSSSTLEALDRLEAAFLPLDLESACPDYGPSLKVHAVAHVARRPGPPIIVQIDSDSIFVAEPTSLLGIDAAAARPVDVKGICTAGTGDAFDAYWRTACALVGVPYERLPTVRTTVDRVLVRASYNGGLVAARRTSGILQRTEEFFHKIADARHLPAREPGFTIRTGAGTASEAGSAFWGTSQAALSLAAVGCGQSIDLLPDGYNFPLHFLDMLVGEGNLPPLVHVHYHWLASGGTSETNVLLDPRLRLAADVREWLRSRLPLRAEA